MSNFMEKFLPPVIIGGVGGSGTRLVAQCLQEAGFFIGSDLNRSNDNLWFTFLFKRIEILDISDIEFNQLIEIFFKGMTGDGKFTNEQINLINELVYYNGTQRPKKWLQKRVKYLLINILSKGMTGSGRFTMTQIKSIKQLASDDINKRPKQWLLERAKSLISDKEIVAPDRKWGWKEPNTHVVVDRLIKTIPNMKYIHVMRNGLDMAYSANQSQPELWGKHFTGSNYTASPFYSLKYWCAVHKRILEVCNSMDNNFLLLNYDNFCTHPEKGLEELFNFMELDITKNQLDKIISLIKVPESIGRFKQHGIKSFDEKDISIVRQLGFSTDA